MKRALIVVTAFTLLCVGVQDVSADTVMVRKKLGAGKYEYVEEEAPGACGGWSIDYRKADGTVWGSNSGRNPDEVQRAHLESVELARIAQEAGASHSEYNYDNPSPIYCLSSSEPRTLHEKLTKAKEEISGFVTKVVADTRRFRRLSKNRPVGQVVKEYSRVLGERAVDIHKLEGELDKGLGIADDPFAPDAMDELHDLVVTFSPEKDAVHNSMDLKWTRAGKTHGELLSLYTNGATQAEFTYIDGRREGKGAMWYANGQKEVEMTYGNGLLEGPLSAWYEDGKPKVKGLFKGGRESGEFSYWYPNGNPESTITWWNGVVSGPAVRFAEFGGKALEGLLTTNGWNGTFRIYWPNGPPRMEGVFAFNVPVGLWRVWDATGSEVGSYKFSNALFHTGVQSSDELPFGLQVPWHSSWDAPFAALVRPAPAPPKPTPPPQPTSPPSDGGVIIKAK